jgi:hypothetical protein
MRLIWIATMIAAVLGEAVSGCSCTKRPAIAPAPAKYVPAARPSGLEDSQLTYKDPASAIMIYVESDRRHIAAIDSTGKILWHKNLVVETGNTPSIYSLSQPSEEDLAGLK